jgi:putative multiple sugar transport system ATP-binding protein
MISSELPELLGMCDRIYVMNEGEIVAEMSAADATQEKIMGAILRSNKKDSMELKDVANSKDESKGA